MKKLIISIVSLLAFALINSAIAAKPEKANILHCGCVLYEDGTIDMVFIDVNVSHKAKGHTKHGEGDIDSCFDGVDTFVDFQRTANDCQISGPDLAGGGLMPCSQVGDVMAGDTCGIELPQ